MLIGVIDQDRLLNKPGWRPNLELMKYSAYHKSRGDMVEFITDIRDISKYSTVYFRKEKLDKHIPSQLLSNPKVQWGGRALSGGYVLLPPQIEAQKADLTLYSSYLGQLNQQGKISNWTMDTIFQANHIRITHKNEWYNKVYHNQIDEHKRVIRFHDENFFSCPDALNILQTLSTHSFYFYEPYHIESVRRLEELLEFNKTLKILYHHNVFALDIPLTKESCHTIFSMIEGCEQYFPICLGHISIGNINEENVMTSIFQTLDLIFYGYSLGYKPKLFPTRQHTLHQKLLREISDRVLFESNEPIICTVSESHKKILLKSAHRFGSYALRIATTPLSQIKKEVWKPHGYSRN